MERRHDRPHELASPHFSMHPLLADVQEMIEMCQDDHLPLQELARFMGQRPIVEATILRAANSVLIGSSRQVQSVRHALVLMGMERVRTLLDELKQIAMEERARIHS